MQFSQILRSPNGHRRPGLDPQPPGDPRCRVFTEGTWKPRKRGIGSSRVPAALTPSTLSLQPLHGPRPSAGPQPRTPGRATPALPELRCCWPERCPRELRAAGRGSTTVTTGRTPRSLPWPCRPTGWPQSAHFHSTCQSQDFDPFDPDVCSCWPSAPPRSPFLPPAQPGRGPRAAFKCPGLGPRAGPGQQELRPDWRVEAGGGGGGGGGGRR